MNEWFGQKIYLKVILFFLLALSGAAGNSIGSPAAKAVTLYCSRGYDTGSYIPNEKYQNFIKGIFKGHAVVFDDQQNKARIMEMLTKSAIFYTNTHSGYPSKPEDGVTEHILQVGPAGGSDYKITALDLAQLRRRIGEDNLPKLIIISGCSIMSGPEQGGRVLSIPEGFGITSRTTGRALIGFASTLPGFRGDGYFRVFFARWVNQQPDGSYLTLEQARTQAIQYIKDWTSRNGNNDSLYMNMLNAQVGENMVILGDASLRFSDVIQ